jgi:glucose/arabinose dehydrogenase/mono/diheme cytochrome c family protein
MDLKTQKRIVGRSYAAYGAFGVFAAFAAPTAAFLPKTPLYAQRGDRAGHEMAPPPAHWQIPPAPVVEPADAPATFALEEGFEIELVAAEPMLHDPVALAFDGNGRIWVAEMMGYMPDIDGKLEATTYGRISVLEDTNGDGKADRHTVFLEDYLLPRALALVDADRGLLFADNERLYEAEIRIDEKGLVSAGKVTLVDEDYAKGGNPEHKPNGLLRAIDNWTYNAKSDKRYRKVEGVWIKEATETRGQWGIAQDDFGRLLTNTNSNLVSVEEIPPGLRVRNPHHSFRSSTVSTIKDQQLWPSRMNPGVNRGYMEGVLDDQGRLQKPTAASGMAVYRGDQFPPAYRGGLFIAEPGANLVKRAVMEERPDGLRTIRSATEGHEFFTSTDERSRIVSVYTAPDGTLHLVDFYRGILQHAAYMTSFLRAQVVERELDKHIGRGRIWRVRHREGRAASEPPRMQDEPTADLVAHLSHANGWWRDTAQRLLVERGGDEALPALRALIENGSDELAVAHAVWTLEGLGRLDPETLARALSASRPRAVAEAIRAAESLARTEKADEALALLAPLAKSGVPQIRRQLAASLGLFGAPAVPVIAELVLASEGDALLGDLALSGLSGHELALLGALPPKAPLRRSLVETLARRNVKEERPKLLALVADSAEPAELRALALAAATHRRAELADALLGLVAAEDTAPPSRKAIVEGLLAGGKDKQFKPIPVRQADSLALAATRKLVTESEENALASLFIVGSGEEESFLLTEADRAQFKLGEAQYQRICLGCHQIHGNGQQYLAPPLVGAEWVLGPEQRLVALVMDGVMGPIEVLGKTYTVPEIQPLMPGLRLNPEFTDEQLAAIMTYVRNAWGNAAPPVKAEAVARYRESVEVRGPWSPEELLKLK